MVEIPRRVTGDDEDYDLETGSGSGSGSGSGNGSVNFETLPPEPTTAPFSYTTLPTPVPTAKEPGVVTRTPDLQGQHSNDDIPTLIIVAGALAVTLVILLIIILTVCLVRRKRKAEVSQRSARWDRAAGAQIATTSGSNRSNMAATAATRPYPSQGVHGVYLQGGPFGVPTTPAPTCSPPPPPAYEYEQSKPISPAPDHADPRSPTPLLCYDSLYHDGSNQSEGYLPPNHYEVI